MRYKHSPLLVEKPGNSVVVPMVDTKSTETDNEGAGIREKKSSLMEFQTILIVHIILGTSPVLYMFLVSIDNYQNCIKGDSPESLCRVMTCVLKNFQ